LTKPLYEAQRGEKGNSWYGKRSKKRPLKKLRGHSKMPLLARCDEALLPICT
jgi:hypothetical protein